jgi:DNA-binding IclR family transcriptional regulator
MVKLMGLVQAADPGAQVNPARRTQSPNGQRRLSSVQSALRLLDHLSQHEDSGVSELARSFGTTKGTVHRLLSSMAAEGFVDQDPRTRRYRLGVKLLTLGTRFQSKSSFQEIARPYLIELRDATGETVNLGVLRGNEVVYVEKIDSREALRIDIGIGSRVPAYCTSLGKAILAFQPSGVRQDYLDHFKPTRKGSARISSRKALREELQHVKKQGYAVDEGEMLPDVCCIGAPILDSQGLSIAAISVSTPASRFAAKRSAIPPVVRLACDRTALALEGIGLRRPL